MRMMRYGYALLFITLFAAPAFAQVDHAEIARAAFDASALPPPPRAVIDALPYITRLLAMLPAGEKAGYVLAPANGDNVALLTDGTPVRVSRVIYPNGQIYKVLSDAPNGTPIWNAEDVNQSLYVPFGGPAVPPPVVTPPTGSGGTVPPPAGTGASMFDAAEIIRRQAVLENELLVIKAEGRETKALAGEAVTQIKDHREATAREYYKWTAIVSSAATVIMGYFKFRAPTPAPAAAP